MSDLTEKQRRFVEEFPKDWNAAAAARRAGYSENTARAIGYENLTKPHIAEAIRRRLDSLTEEADVTTSEIIEGLKKEAKREEEGSSHSARVSAWSHLGKYKGMFTERVEHTHRLLIVDDLDEW